MSETATLLTALRERDIKLWVEDNQLKCSAPAGALDAECEPRWLVERTSSSTCCGKSSAIALRRRRRMKTYLRRCCRQFQETFRCP